MNAGLIPVHSSKDADILNYRKGLISFYEKRNIHSLCRLFSEQADDPG